MMLSIAASLCFKTADRISLDLDGQKKKLDISFVREL